MIRGDRWGMGSGRWCSGGSCHQLDGDPQLGRPPVTQRSICLPPHQVLPWAGFTLTYLWAVLGCSHFSCLPLALILLLLGSSLCTVVFPRGCHPPHSALIRSYPQSPTCLRLWVGQLPGPVHRAKISQGHLCPQPGTDPLHTGCSLGYKGKVHTPFLAYIPLTWHLFTPQRPQTPHLPGQQASVKGGMERATGGGRGNNLPECLYDPASALKTARD